MNDEELKKEWQRLDTRIETINQRTKAHTMDIKELQKQVKELQEQIKLSNDRWRI